MFRAEGFQPTSPLVEVELLGTSADQGQKARTRVAPDNGFNPVWGETMSFTVRVPDLAFLRFTVLAKGDLLGQAVVPVLAARPGLRSVPLHDTLFETRPYAVLMVDLACAEVAEEASAEPDAKGLQPPPSTLQPAVQTVDAADSAKSGAAPAAFVASDDGYLALMSPPPFKASSFDNEVIETTFMVPPSPATTPRVSHGHVSPLVAPALVVSSPPNTPS